MQDKKRGPVQVRRAADEFKVQEDPLLEVSRVTVASPTLRREHGIKSLAAKCSRSFIPHFSSAPAPPPRKRT